MTQGAVRLWLKVEGFIALVVALWFYAQTPGGWVLFAWLFLAPSVFGSLPCRTARRRNRLQSCALLFAAPWTTATRHYRRGPFYSARLDLAGAYQFRPIPRLWAPVLYGRW